MERREKLAAMRTAWRRAVPTALCLVALLCACSMHAYAAGDDGPIAAGMRLASTGSPVVTVTDEVIRGDIRVHKVDADSSGSTPQGSASLEKARFDVYNDSAGPVVVGGVTYPGEGSYITTIETDGTGVAVLSGLPYGTYTVKEADAPAGYLFNSGWSRTVRVREDGATVDVEACPDQVMRGSVTVFKVDADTGASVAEGDAKFKGAEFVITNMSVNPVYVNGGWHSYGEAVDTFGIESGDSCTYSGLPYGTYSVREVAAPSGYHVNATWSEEFTVTYDGESCDLSSAPVADTVWRGILRMRKADADTRTSTPQGDATFAGAQFTVYNRSEGPVKVAGSVHAPGAAVGKLTVADDSGEAEFRDLPYGTYEVVETAPPARGYATDPSYTRTFTIRSDGQVVDYTGSSDAVYDPVLRGCLEVLKVDADTMRAVPEGGGTLEGTVFKVYNIGRRPVMAGPEGSRRAYAPLPKVAGKWITEGAIPVATLTTGADGRCSLPASYLPYGTYLLVEDTAPSGYLLNLEFSDGVEFSIGEGGEVYRFTDTGRGA